MARPPLGRTVVVLVVLVAAARSCAARDFYVGGRDGWTPHPGEPNNSWAERNRFQVNDTLVFRYNKDVDGVLLVNQSHYDACDVTEPILRLGGGGGDSRFVLPHSGPYFFISTNTSCCQAGERLIVVVLAIHDKDFRNIPSPLPPPPPPPPPKSASPASLAPPSSSASAPPPRPVPSQTSPPSPSARNASSSPSPAPLIAPVPVTNGPSCAPSITSSAAVASRAGVLACFVVVAGAALL